MKKTNETGFVVMGVRFFCNEEHHWIAPSDIEEAKAFGDKGDVRELEGYGKPVFESMTDAEHYAMSLTYGEYTLAQYETKRPTWYVVEEWVYVDIVDKDRYSYPSDAEAWSDAKVADFERECDCEDIVNLAVWDSENDEERVSETVLKVITEINGIDGLAAWVEDGRVAVSPTKTMNKEAVADYIEGVSGFPHGKVKWVKSDESVNTAWYEVK